MPNPPPGSNRTNISIDLIGDNFRGIVRTALDHGIQEVISDLEVAYHSHRGDGVEVSVTIDYSVRELHNDNDDRARRNGQMARERNAEAVRRNAQSAGINWIVERADRSVRNTNERRETQVQQQQNEPARPTLFSAAARLLGFLPVVNVDSLSEDKRSCPVCTERFSAADKPILIKCNHVVGRACIEQWILSGHNSCPLCRAAMFEPAG